MATLIRLIALVEKDFRQMYRNKTILALLLVYPLFIGLISSHLVNFDLRNLNVAIVDADHSDLSGIIRSDISNTAQLSLVGIYSNHAEAQLKMEQGEVECIVEIPANYERDWITALSSGHAGEMMPVITSGEKSAVGQILVSCKAVKTTNAMLGAQYVLGSLSHSLWRYAEQNGIAGDIPESYITSVNLYNPTMNYLLYMLPVIFLSLAITLCSNVTGTSMANELNYGTLDQINVTPLSRSILVSSKILVCYIVGIIEMIYTLLVNLWVYDLAPTGSIGALWLIFSLFIICVSAFAVWISNISTNTTQILLVISVVCLVAQMMSGFETPIESMPEWIQPLTYCTPARFLVIALRNIYLKGATLTDLWAQFIPLLAYATVLTTAAIGTYKKSKVN